LARAQWRGRAWEEFVDQITTTELSEDDLDGMSGGEAPVDIWLLSKSNWQSQQTGLKQIGESSPPKTL
jgi:hypothetical protein